jgi:MFS family permease
MTRTRLDQRRWAASAGERRARLAESFQRPRGVARPVTRPMTVFWLLFAINLVNYLDRLIVVAVGPTLKSEFRLNDHAIGLLSSAFLLVYTIAALPLGALGDRARSKARVVALGVGLWSVFSGLTALATGYVSLIVTRALVGVGEASYYPAGTALLSSYFPRAARARIMGGWQAAQLVGILLAFALAGTLFAFLPAPLAWRLAFLVTAIPGLALCALMWRVADAPTSKARAPETADAIDAIDAIGGAHAPQTLPKSLSEQVLAAMRVPTIWIVIALQAIIFITATPAITFLPIYVRARPGPFQLGAAHAAFLTGFIVVVGGLAGTLLGGRLADWLSRWHAGGRVLAVAVGLLIALPCYATMLLTHHLIVFAIFGALAVLALNLPAGPLTAIPQDVAPPGLRATVVAVTMLFSHLLGDVWSPAAVGALATALDERASLALLIVGAPALALGVVIAFIGAGRYARTLRARPEN